MSHSSIRNLLSPTMSRRILLAVMLTELIGLLVAGGLAYLVVVSELRYSIGDRLVHVGSQVGISIENLLEPVKSHAQTVVSALQLDPEGHTPVEVWLEDLLRVRREVNSIALYRQANRPDHQFSRFGTIAFNSDQTPHHLPLVERALAGEQQIGQVRFNKLAEPIIDLALPVQVVDESRAPRQQALVLEIGLRWLESAVSAHGHTDHATIYILNRRHEVIAHPDSSWVFARINVVDAGLPSALFSASNPSDPKGYHRYQTLAGEEVVGVAVWDEALGWWIVAEEPVEQAMAPLDRVVEQFLTILFGVLALTVIAAQLISGSAVRPLVELNGAVRRLAGGERNVQVTVAIQVPELIELAESFNSMATGLDRSLMALREESRRAQVTLKSIADGVITTGRDTLIERLNPTAEQMTGWIANDAVGMPVERVFRIKRLDSDDLPDLEQWHSGRCHLTNRQGERSLIEFNASPILITEQGQEQAGMVVVFRDITHAHEIQRRLEVSERDLRLITDSTREAIIRTDGDGLVAFWNPGAERVFGYHSSDAIGLDALERLAGSGDSRGRAVWLDLILGRNIASGQIIQLEGRRRNGTLFPLEAMVAPIAGEPDSGGGAVLTLRDVSERHESERALRRQRNLYSALSALNHVIVQLVDGRELFTRVCRILVEFGGLQMVWIASQENGHGLIVDGSYASSDFEQTCRSIGDTTEMPLPLEQLWEGGGRSLVVNDLGADFAADRWSTELLAAGLGSMIVFPIQRDGHCSQLLVVHARPVGFFTDDLIGLVAEVARDISFALDNLDREHERMRIESLLQDIAEGVTGATGEAYFTALVNHLSAAFGTAHAFIAMIDKDDPGQMRVISSVFDGVRTGDFSYRIDGTPCHDALTAGVFVHPSGVRDAYPEDELLAEIGAEGYAAAPIRDRDGNATGLLVVVDHRPLDQGAALYALLRLFAIRVSTEIQRIEAESDLRLAATAFQAAEGIFITNPTGVILRANDAVVRMTGYPVEELIGNNASIFASGRQDRAFYEAMWQTLASEGRWQGELWNRRRNGQLYLESLSITAVHDNSGKVSHYVAHLEDVTEERRVEQALREAKERAEHANRSKSEFLAMMSHEIRTPMNAIMGINELLRDCDQQEERSSLLTTQLRASNLLLDIISDVLELARVEAGKLTIRLQQVGLAGTIAGVEGMLADRCREKGLDFSITISDSAPTELVTDPARLRQILLNVAGNAIKFTETGVVEVVISGRDDGSRKWLMMVVRDSGIGIPESEHERIFDPFTQVDGYFTRDIGGVGLGLTITRRMVDLLHGSIVLQSQPGVGSTFSIELPLEQSNASEPQSEARAGPATGGQPTGSEPAPEGLRILLAEDAEDNALLIRAFLKAGNHLLTHAKDGIEALDHYREQPFDLVLMDIQMPRMDGYDTTRAIRGWELENSHSRTPIIALTAHAYAEDEARSIEVGCDLHVTKPVSKKRLLEVIARFA